MLNTVDMLKLLPVDMVRAIASHLSLRELLQMAHTANRYKALCREMICKATETENWATFSDLFGEFESRDRSLFLDLNYDDTPEGHKRLSSIFNVLKLKRFDERGLLLSKMSSEYDSSRLLPALKRAMCSSEGVIALLERLITVAGAKTLIPANNRTTFLTTVLSKWGLRVLRRGLMTPESALTFTPFQREKLFTAYGLQALYDGTMTIEIFKSLTRPHIKLLMTYYGLQGLREKLFTIEQFKSLPILMQELVTTEKGGYFLRTKVVAIEQLRGFSPKTCHSFLTSLGLDLLFKHNMSVTAFRDLSLADAKIFIGSKGAPFSCAKNFSLLGKKGEPQGINRLLFSSYTLQALREMLLTVEQFQALPVKAQGLIATESGPELLRRKVTTIEQLQGFSPETLKTLLMTDYGLQGLRKKLFTITQFQALPVKAQGLIATAFGLELLRCKIVTIEQLQGLLPASLDALFTSFGLEIKYEENIAIDVFLNYLQDNRPLVAMYFLREKQILSNQYEQILVDIDQFYQNIPTNIRELVFGRNSWASALYRNIIDLRQCYDGNNFLVLKVLLLLQKFSISYDESCYEELEELSVRYGLPFVFSTQELVTLKSRGTSVILIDCQPFSIANHLPPNITRITLVCGATDVLVRHLPACIKDITLAFDASPSAVRAIPPDITKVTLEFGLSPEAVGALPPHIETVIIASDQSNRTLGALPIHIKKIVLATELPPETVMNLPHHIASFELSGDLSLAAIAALPTYINTVTLSPDFLSEAVAALPAHIERVILVPGIVANTLRALPPHITHVEGCHFDRGILPAQMRKVLPKHVTHVDGKRCFINKPSLRSAGFFAQTSSLGKRSSLAPPEEAPCPKRPCLTTLGG